LGRPVPSGSQEEEQRMATVSDRPPRTTAPSGADGRQGVIDLARTAVEDTVRLVRLEIQLARVELQEMITSNLRAAMTLAVAGLFIFLALIMFLVWIALAVPNHPLAALIELAVLAIVGLALGAIGALSLMRNLRALKSGPLPKTMTTLKEDAEWAKHLLKRNGK
jgi:uncharacterized membrane protein YqjE